MTSGECVEVVVRAGYQRGPPGRRHQIRPARRPGAGPPERPPAARNRPAQMRHENSSPIERHRIGVNSTRGPRLRWTTQPPFAVHTAISTTLPALALPSRIGRLRRNRVSCFGLDALPAVCAVAGRELAAWNCRRPNARGWMSWRARRGRGVARGAVGSRWLAGHRPRLGSGSRSSLWGKSATA